MTQNFEEIIKGKVCPYCYGKTEFVDSEIIYGKSYGMIYLCRPCDAYCGVHKGTDQALGRLANKELRGYKKLAHEYFDKLWNTKGGMTRNEAYKWLSQQLGLNKEHTHIGMFSVKTCKRVIEVCSKYHLNQ